MAQVDFEGRVGKFIQDHQREIDEIKTQLATGFEAPAQRIINAGFARMRVSRFDRSGNDLWEMVTCYQNGWDYEKPPAELVTRWQRGYTLLPVLAVLTALTVAAVLIAQSGLLSAVLARLAEVR